MPGDARGARVWPLSMEHHERAASLDAEGRIAGRCAPRSKVSTMPPKPPTKYVSISDAAHILGMSTKTIRRMIARGDLAAVRFGKRTMRIPADALAAAARPVAAWATN